MIRPQIRPTKKVVPIQASKSDSQSSSDRRMKKDVGLSLASAVLTWMAFPPFGWTFLVWLAPLGWLAIVHRNSPVSRSTYWALWLGGFLHWVLMLQGIRLAHWANYFGLIPLAAYLGIYVPAFVGATRIATRSLHWPLVLAAPLTWTGLEITRTYLFTGFGIGLLGHSQFRILPLIQISDLFGAYTVSALIVFVSAAISQALFTPRAGTRNYSPIVLAVGVMLSVLGYGTWRLATSGVTDERNAQNDLRVAIVQGSIDTVLAETRQQKQSNLEHYWRLTEKAFRDHPDAELFVWPESAFAGDLPEFLVAKQATGRETAGVSEPDAEHMQQLQIAFQHKLDRLAGILRMSGQSQPRSQLTQFVVGCATLELGDSYRTYNSVLQIDSSGIVRGRYYKMHRVPFGEYLPFGSWIPWLYSSGLTPLSGGLAAGESAANFQITGWRISPSICFESTVPQVIRRHIQTLSARGEPPDALVNVTDDGWFRGSSILDLHLACSVFRAVENRRPLIVAANTGLSAIIDGNGRFQAEGPRRQTATLVANVRRDGRSSLYLWWGDIPGTISVAAVAILFAVGWHSARRQKQSSTPT